MGPLTFHRCTFTIAHWAQVNTLQYAIDPYWQMVHCGLVTNIVSLKGEYLPSDVLDNWEHYEDAKHNYVRLFDLCLREISKVDEA